MTDKTINEASSALRRSRCLRARRAILEAFRAQVAPELRRLGFIGRGGHWVRRTTGDVLQVVELQHAIYGGRMTVNLGLDLGFLKPLARWVSRPTFGPHAHESARWIRIGFTRARPEDHWWSFDPEAGDEPTQVAAALGAAIFDDGLAWLEREARPEAFLRFAEGLRDRSRTFDHPDGGWLELRLLAAVLAWVGAGSRAQAICSHARPLWPLERARLEAARNLYRRARAGTRRKLPPVPDLQAELEAFISTTTAWCGPALPRAARPRRSRSGRLRSAPA